MSTRGMVLGKFMPPHAGHCLLVDFARSWVDELDVLLFGTGDDEIPADARVAWARELFAGAKVQHVNQLLPDFEDAPEAFANIVAEVVKTTFPDGLEYVFGSAAYGEQLAELAGARYVPVDPDCELLPVRASELREDPLEHWEFLPHCVRPHYVKRVCLIGPDGTGKSALAEQLDHSRFSCLIRFGDEISGTPLAADVAEAAVMTHQDLAASGRCSAGCGVKGPEISVCEPRCCSNRF